MLVSRKSWAFVQVSQGPDCSGGHRSSGPHRTASWGSSPPSSLGTRPKQAACGGLSSLERLLWGWGGIKEVNGQITLEPPLTACLSLESLERHLPGRRRPHCLAGSAVGPRGQVPSRDEAQALGAAFSGCCQGWETSCFALSLSVLQFSLTSGAFKRSGD